MKNKLLNILKPFGQEHLLTFWDNLSPQQRRHLSVQIESIDFPLLELLYVNRNHPTRTLDLADKSADPYGYKFSTVRNLSSCIALKPITSQEAIVAGNVALSGDENFNRENCSLENSNQEKNFCTKNRSGKVGAILVAGGQGTRLGFQHPKGLFPIGVVAGTLLIQIHFEKIIAISRRVGFNIPFAVMTSPATHFEILESLEQNDYFGFDPADVFLFCQGTMPTLNETDGKILLENQYSISLNPDGHGGMLAAMTRKQSDKNLSVFEFFKSRGVKYLYYNQIDNPLAQTCSPEFMGYHILSGSEFTTQVIRKKDPTEKCGNVVRIGESLHMIEYIELPDEIARRTNPDGSLHIWAGNTAIHAFDLDFLEQMTNSADKLHFHTARKKTPFIDISSGTIVKPTSPNAVKFERFIFDLLPYAKNAIVVEVDEANHYAPLKNESGAATHSPEQVQCQMTSQFISWLRAAGAIVMPKTPIEISPLFADSEEVLIKKIKPGITFDSPTYLRADLC
ncbi:MAG: UTP--glucose-1-phosphate uridylyltransferase [Planctomycetaceae bacterium]|jgi:UDP-N-acetylglucosamine/UDP-N-acetylgalactosamine diphosphorylase|nr:UTP--glucose-1-phosphate uridylyltransferase [Planctomycetaceae bacterium]